MCKGAALAAGLALLAAPTSLPALANDSTAELATGGLIFVHNDNVEMRAEDLFISARAVRVRYRFFNKAADDVTVLVAFPLPEVRISSPDDNIALPTDNPVNIVGFTTRVDGRIVKTKVEQRAIALGIDRTRLLQDLGIPLAPQLQSTSRALDQLPPDKWSELVRLGLAEIDEYDEGKGMHKHLEPRWGLHTTFYWEQTFPAGKETIIEHDYKPSVGESVQTSLGAPYAQKESWYADFLRKYCIDNDFLAAVERLRKINKSEYGPPYSEQRIDYILKTGANWSGPIKDFHLVVDKGDPTSLVSFCGDGVKKISATQFEMNKTDFTPEGDLAVLILKKMPKQ
jgi:Domain of unknown function (DUF4424)